MDKSWLFFIVPFCSLFIGVGAWLMFMSGGKIAEGVKASHWPQTTGQLLTVESKDTSDAESNGREIRVRYSYSANGRSYEGSTVHPAYGNSSFESAHRGLEAVLKPPQQVRVYYDEANPNRSTLSAGFYSCSLTLLFGGFIFFGAGIGFLLTFWFALAGNQDFASGISVLH